MHRGSEACAEVRRSQRVHRGDALRTQRSGIVLVAEGAQRTTAQDRAGTDHGVVVGREHGAIARQFECRVVTAQFALQPGAAVGDDRIECAVVEHASHPR